MGMNEAREEAVIDSFSVQQQPTLRQLPVQQQQQSRPPLVQNAQNTYAADLAWVLQNEPDHLW